MNETHTDGDNRTHSSKRVILNFFAAHVLDTEFDRSAVSARALIEVCQSLGIAEHASRSTLKRLVASGLLERRRTGRTAGYRLTARARAVLHDGHRKITESLTPRTDAGAELTWVLVAFSLPDHEQKLRNAIRTRLQWAGFAPLQSGLWIAPSPADVSSVKELDAGNAVRIFSAQPESQTNMTVLAQEIWDLPGIAANYREFTARWSDADRLEDDLARELAVTEDWLTIIGRDPRLPHEILPLGWPAAQAAESFSRVVDSAGPVAAQRARALLSASAEFVTLDTEEIGAR